MTALNAITNDALLSIIEWGEGALRAPAAGETAWVLANVNKVDQIIIDTNKPSYTKVVASVATAMTPAEKDVIDDARNGTHLAVAGPLVIDWNIPHHEIQLAGNLAAGDITFVNVPSVRGPSITVEVVQGGVGGFTFDVAAWTGVDWGSGTVPTFGDHTDERQRIELHINNGGSSPCGFADGVVFGAASLPALAGLVARWRHDALDLTLTVGDVSGHADKTAGPHNLFQGIAAEMPTLDVETINGRGAALYCQTGAGFRENMSTPDHADLDMGQNTFMVLMVMKRAQLAAFKVVWAKTDSTDANNLRGFINNSHKLQLFWGSDVQSYTASTSVIPNDVSCLVGWGIDASSNEVVYVINGVVERFSVTLAGTGSNAFAFRIGGDGFSTSYAEHPFDLAETIVYKRDGVTAWTDAELQSIYNDYAKPYYDL